MRRARSPSPAYDKGVKAGLRLIRGSIWQEGLSARHARDRSALTETYAGNESMETANDMKAHGRTYDSFIGLLKWSVPLIAVITAVVVVLIGN